MWLISSSFVDRVLQVSCFVISLIALSAVHAQSQANYDFVVSQDGKGDFKTVQEAINAVPDFRKNPTNILIKNGVYKEKLILPTSKTNVKFFGEDQNKTILTYDAYASKKNGFGEEIGTSGSCSFYVFADDFSARNITFQNSAGPVGQAVAVRVDGDRVRFDSCRFLGFQDTLYPRGEKSRQYYKHCYIEGTVDFIFGWSTAVFDSCVIFCKKGGGYVTAASTLEETTHGFAFINCRVTGDAPESSFYLGRPWRPYAKTVFINCFLDKQIRIEGWHNWSKPDAEKTSFYAEYESTGPGAGSSNRVNWSHQLTEAEAELYTPEKIFVDWKVSE
jgi:pectinesterase